MAIHSHLALMMLYAFFVSVVAGVLMKDRARELTRVAGVIFASLVGGAYLAGWLLRIFPL
jgi:undecaprenyl pyrophosphate phosphatase UppP